MVRHKIAVILSFAAGSAVLGACASNTFEAIDPEDQAEVDCACQTAYDIEADDGFDDTVTAADYVDESGNPLVNYRMCRRNAADKYDICINAVTDKYCGACDVRCKPPSSCQRTVDPESGQSVYACSCEDGLSYCGGACVDTQTDPNFCGSCATVCPTDKNGQQVSCTNGKCLCADGYILHEGECIDIMTNRSHCGSIGNACYYGTRCAEGKCTRCPDGFVFIEGGHTISVGGYDPEGGQSDLESLESEDNEHSVYFFYQSVSGNVPDWYDKVAQILTDEKQRARYLFKVMERRRQLTVQHDFCIMQYEMHADAEEWFKNPYDLSGSKPMTSMTWGEAASTANRYTEYLNQYKLPGSALPFCYAPVGEGGVCVAEQCEMVDAYRSNYAGCRGVRLPSEYEWEYAARGGGGAGATTYRTVGVEIGAGETTTLSAVPKTADELVALISNYAWYHANSGKTLKNVVETEKKPNALGLYNMEGNVSEWTNDAFIESHYNELDIASGELPAATLLTDPHSYRAKTGDQAVFHIVRGCSYLSYALECRDGARRVYKENAGFIGQRYVIGPIYDADGNLITLK